MISLGPLKDDGEVPALLAASARQFGADGYQHLPRYLHWLYAAKPNARGIADCLVARQDGELVGAMHRMVLPLTGSDGAATLGVLHNHFTADTVRSGAGVLLLRRAVKDVDVGFAPGVQAPLDEIYRRLGFAILPASWLIKVISPVGVAGQMARGRLIAREPMRVALARLSGRVTGISVSASPEPASLDSLCQAMRGTDATRLGVDWTPALVRWRFFDPAGPRHVLLSSHDDRAMAVVSFGVRRAITVARLVELVGSPDATFVGGIERIMRAAGAVLGLAFAAGDKMIPLLAASGWRIRDGGTYSFRTGGAALDLGAGATDVGFEAFNTEFTT